LVAFFVQKLEALISSTESEALMGGAADGSAEHSKVRADAAIQKLERGSERWEIIASISSFFRMWPHNVFPPCFLFSAIRQFVRLARTKMLVAEMEETGADIAGTLAENREKIASAHDKVMTPRAGY
jgi:hypothetical protein